MAQLLVATSNPGKIREIIPYLAEFDIELIGLESFGEDEDFEESGSTFKENAASKALHYNQLHGLPTIADDSGLVISAMNGEPGVHSSRYLGLETGYDDKMNHILDRMKGIPWMQREAYFVCSLAFALEGEIFCCITKKVFGYIAEKPLGRGGFGYDPIFFCPELDTTFGQAKQSEKDRVSHRSRAVTTLVYLFETHEQLRNLMGIT